MDKELNLVLFQFGELATVPLTISLQITIISIASHLQVDDGISAMAIHRRQGEVSVEIFGIKSGDGQAVTVTSLYERKPPKII